MSGLCPLPNANIVDFVGWGNAGCYEGTGNAPTHSNTNVTQRKFLGCFDTDNNAADFVSASFNLRNSASPKHCCWALSITCPADVTVTSGDPAGAVVSYTVQVSGGCAPITTNCTPPSGNLFPVGTTAVNCTGTDSCGQQAACSFNVTVLYQPNLSKEIFFTVRELPPFNGVYVTPAMWHASFASGIVIRDVRHRAFTASVTPPALGADVTHSFGSQVEMDVSTDNGGTWTRATAPAGVSAFIHHSLDAGGVESYDTEMLNLSAAGGGLPSGIQIRESPTRAGTGSTTVRAVPGGYMVSSFFDIYIEVSTDGITWEEASAPAHVELRSDPELARVVPTPTRLLPSPVDNYVSPADYHIALASGIVIKDIRHKLFTDAVTPPLVGAAPATHHFDSQLDFQLSQDGGLTWTATRAPASVDVKISRLSSGEEELYDAEMMA